MGFKDLMVLQKVKLGIISLTLLMVLVLTGLVLGPAFSNPPEILKNVDTPMRAIASLGVGGGIEISKVESPSSFPSYETIDLSCLNAATTKAYKTGSKHVRLRGRSCLGQMNTDESRITNLTSGLDATLFETNTNVYSSDFVRLVDGKNEIDLKIEGQNGQIRTAKVIIEKIKEL